MFYLRDILFNYADFLVKLKTLTLSSKIIKKKKLKHAELYNTRNKKHTLKSTKKIIPPRKLAIFQQVTVPHNC